MPSTLSFPGIYVEEIPSGVRTIIGVATSITGFIGRALSGQTGKPIVINSFGDFEREFGGLWIESALGYAVRDFYLNGGSQAIIVRLFHPPFASEAERSEAHDGAFEVADAAKKKGNVNDARIEARRVANGIAGRPGVSEAVAKAAKEVADKIDALDPHASTDDLKKVADAAVLAAAPFSKAKVSAGVIKLQATTEGGWGRNLRAIVDLEDIPQSNTNLFNLTVRDAGEGGAVERFFDLSVDQNSPRRADEVLARESKLVRWDGALSAPSPNGPIRQAIDTLDAALKETPPNPEKIAGLEDALWLLSQDTVTQAENKVARAKKALESAQNSGADTTGAQTALDYASAELAAAIQARADSVTDGPYLTINDFLPPAGRSDKKGLYAFELADLFNLLCIPPYRDPIEPLDVDVNLIAAAATYCEERRSMLLVDPPKTWTSKSTAVDEFNASTDHIGTRSKNAAIFFPRLREPNPLRDNKLEDFAPCGAAAGIFARTDTQRGVWKAPAGFDATLVGVPQLTVSLTNAENGDLNQLGINCLLNMPAAGNVVWGSRTLQGNDRLASEWKYLPVRRTALFLEESLYRALPWVVFESNDEPLWAQIRLNVGAFLNTLFRQGAFQGSTPREAYFVKCDKETTTQNDIDRGVVNILVGFAPLKPAEFVVIKLQQIAGQIQT